MCKGYHNPDKLLIRCSNHDCDLWLHEDCIINDGVAKAYAEVLAAEGVGGTMKIKGYADGDNGEASGTIEVARQVPKAIENTSNRMNTPLPTKSVSKSSGKKRGHLRRCTTIDTETWEGDWKGKIETEPKMSARGEEVQEITGKLIITDLRGIKAETIERDLRCPNCDELLTPSSDG